MTLHRFQSILALVDYPGLTFEFNKEDRNWQLRVVCRDSVRGLHEWNGRWWRLSGHMTDGEVVQTAFKAVMTALEHEAREVFTYKGVSVFDPHYDIDLLVALRSEPGGGLRGRS